MSTAQSTPGFDPADVDLVPMRRRHIRQVLRIEALVYPRPWSAALFLQEIARRSDRVYIVARYESDVLGYGGLITTGLEAHVTNIAIDPAYQGNHIGMRVMVALMEAAVDHGATSVSLEVRKSNAPAQTMYRRFGFRPVGIRRGYYIETGEDAIVMLAEDVHTVEYAERLDELRHAAAQPSTRQL